MRADIATHCFDTPIGPMCVGAVDRGICLLEFLDRGRLQPELHALQRLLDADTHTGENDLTRQAEQQLDEYFSGTRTDFDLPLVTPGTAFQQAVWHTLLRIPFGQTISYGEQAARMEKPEAVRAVAAANGQNRIAIVIPCHRVIGKNGALTGYGGGLERKHQLLLHERKQAGDADLFSSFRGGSA
jgi:AraC family transcriptional regulator, regulatory protein of adaptative response / methylated-DNA-[protein]-cysteine methyltransferase